MATVWIPSLLRLFTDGKEQVTVPGRTLGQVVDALESAYPRLQGRLCRNGRIAPSVQAHVDGRSALMGLAEPVEESSEILFLPKISGG